jgi:hypothetical protein
VTAAIHARVSTLEQDWTDEAVALALDASGDVLVTGWSSNTCGGGSATCWDFVTVKYSSTGAELWTAAYSGPQYGDVPSAIGADAAGDVYVTGVIDRKSSLMAPSNLDYVTVKYDASGALQRASGL